MGEVPRDFYESKIKREASYTPCEHTIGRAKVALCEEFASKVYGLLNEHRGRCRAFRLLLDFVDKEDQRYNESVERGTEYTVNGDERTHVMNVDLDCMILIPGITVKLRRMKEDYAPLMCDLDLPFTYIRLIYANFTPNEITEKQANGRQTFNWLLTWATLQKITVTSCDAALEILNKIKV